jgi:hypothetical protein
VATLAEREDMTKTLERLAVIAMLLWLASFILDPVIMGLTVMLGGPDAAMRITAMDIMPFSIKTAIASLVQIGVGIWLFKQAKRDGNSPFVWGLFGFVFSITAVVLYLLTELLKEMRAANNRLNPTEGS